jgi:predicted nuclease with TOPRIM domain
MKLTIEEQGALLELIRKFSEMDSDLQKAEDELNSIDERRKQIVVEMNALKDRAEGFRQMEELFTQELINKYGPFTLNMETFEIIPA